MSLLATLKLHAASSGATSSNTPVYQLDIDAARKAVKIKDGRKVKAEDGSQDLVLTLGRITLSLDVIATGANRIQATADQVEEFSAALAEELANGTFDEAIVEAQGKAKEAAERAKEKATKVVTAESEGLTEETAAEEAGVDLDSLED